MTVAQLAFYIWNYLRRTSGERAADENWFLAEHILQGNRPPWLFDDPLFDPWGIHQDKASSLFSPP